MNVERNISNAIIKSHAALAAAVPSSALCPAQRLLHLLSGRLMRTFPMSNTKCLRPVREILLVRDCLKSADKNMVADILALDSLNCWLR
jgi:hypothetical protein